MLRSCLCVSVICLLAWPAVAADFVDDFQAVATYDTTSLLAPCYGGDPTKYTVLELTDFDIFNEQAVSGGGRFRISNSKYDVSGALAGSGRQELAVIGWVGLGIICPGEPAFKHNTVNFTANDLCLYGGYTFNNFQLQHAKRTLGDLGDCNIDEGCSYWPTFGPDGGPGVANVDDDGNGTTDDPNPYCPFHPDCDPNRIGDPSPEYLWPGLDGAPGAAGVDDDGINGTDDQGEFGWPGSDDSDDTIGRWGFFAAMRVRLEAPQFWPTGMFIVMDTRSSTAQFTIRELGTVWGFNPWIYGTLSPGFYDPFVNYNYMFCAHGTCYGAMMWTDQDMANPNEVIGPTQNSLHNEPEDSQVLLGGFNISSGRYALLQNATHQGNTIFSDKFWVIGGDPMQYPHFPSIRQDLDGDKDVDGSDFLTFSLCYNGSIKAPQSGCANMQADMDGDDDVDGFDFTTWALCHNGSLKRPQASCMPPGLPDLYTCATSPNDTCDGATELSEGSWDDTIVAAGTRSYLPVCAPTDAGRDLWFEYTPSCTGTATISTCDTDNIPPEEGPVSDVIIEIYSVANPCTAGEQPQYCTVGDTCPDASRHETVDVSVTQDVPILIQVLGDNNNKLGKFRLTITNSGCP